MPENPTDVLLSEDVWLLGGGIQNPFAEPCIATTTETTTIPNTLHSAGQFNPARANGLFFFSSFDPE